MPLIDVDQESFDKLSLVAGVTGSPMSAVVRMMLERVSTRDRSLDATGQDGGATAAATATAAAPPASSWVPVRRTYKGHDVEGEFNPATMEVRIMTAPWSGQVFPSPTAAARHVVERFSPARETSNTNGRKFWRVVATGKNLISLVGPR